jgi:tetratricopeptide (TPR) repeat protein/transcriptional regulator with XRE-family HTH domain
MFSRQVRAHRRRLGMTQEELAARAGVSVRSIRNLEAGRIGRPRPGTARLLADAFGLSGAERDRFCQAALDDTAPPAGEVRSRPVPAQLPADVAGFVGRTDQLNRLSELLDQGDRPATVVISAIAGTPGVGKTALAVHWAHRSIDRFPDGQLYSNLRGFDPAGIATPGQVVRSFLDALDVPAQRVPEGLDAQAALYRSLLTERRMLVLLDNARDADQVRPLLPGAPGCLVLVTSRNQLTGLIAAAGALPLPLDLLSRDEAGDLLARRVGADRVAAEPAAVEEIVERCARLPLALAIVATRAATQPGLPLAALAAELRGPDDRLDTLATGDPSTDVRSVFSWSYRQLSGPAARLFRLLGVHPGPDLSVSAAAALAGISAGRARPVLGELVRAHLVGERVPGRYTPHDLLRVYAGELVAADEPPADRDAAVHRLVDHYVRSAARADAVLNPARDVIDLVVPPVGGTVDEFEFEFESEASATEWFTTEYQVLLAAVRLAVDAALDRQAWQLVWSMATYLERHQGFRDAVALQRIALAAARRIDDLPAQAYSHRLLGRAQAMLGDPGDARSHLEHALEAYRRLGDDTNQGLVHLGLAAMLDRQGRFRDALHQAEQALARFRTSGYRIGYANALNNVGWFHARLGDYRTSLAYGEQALGLQQELGNRRGEALTRDSLGVAYHHLGRHADAVAAYRQALELLREHGNPYYEAETLVHLGDIHHADGDAGAARDHWQAALTILTDLDHPDSEQVRARLRDPG